MRPKGFSVLLIISRKLYVLLLTNTQFALSVFECLFKTDAMEGMPKGCLFTNIFCTLYFVQLGQAWITV